MRDVLQSTARKFFIYMADSTTPTTAKTGLSSFTVYLAKSGGAENTVSPTITERGHGWYEVTPTTSHRDTLGENAWTFTATGAVDFPMKETVVAVDNQVAVWGASTATPVQVAAEVWDALKSEHVDAGSFGLALSGVEQTATDIETKVDTIDDFIDTEIAAIKAKTDNLPTDPADQSAVEAAISASQAAMTILLNAIAGYIDTEVAAIKAKTDNLPTDPADASDITASFASVSATLTTIASYIDTEIAAIKAKTDNLPTDPADQSALEALLSTITTELAKVHKSGQTRRYTQVAISEVNKTADVTLGDPL